MEHIFLQIHLYTQKIVINEIQAVTKLKIHHNPVTHTALRPPRAYWRKHVPTTFSYLYLIVINCFSFMVESLEFIKYYVKMFALKYQQYFYTSLQNRFYINSFWSFKETPRDHGSHWTSWQLLAAAAAAGAAATSPSAALHTKSLPTPLSFNQNALQSSGAASKIKYSTKVPC